MGAHLPRSVATGCVEPRGTAAPMIPMSDVGIVHAIFL